MRRSTECSAVATAACLLVAAGCGSSSQAPSMGAETSSGSGSGAGSGAASGAGSGSGASSGSAASGSGASDGGGSGSLSGGDASVPSCAPTLPSLPWTSPYAGWTRGIPTDPSFFPIAVWLQGSWHATELAGLGVNIYVGNNSGTDSLAASDLATLKAQHLYAIVGQDSVGLANIDDPTIVGWWMDPDEPDNAQSDGMGGYGPPVAPSTIVSRYDAYKKADPTRPIYVGLGMGVAYEGWEGRGSNAPAESGYVPGSDVISFDIYPYNNCGGDTNEQVTCGQFWLNAYGVDRLHTWSNRGQAVWTDIETTIIDANSTHGPTPQQTTSEVWLSLIHGASGIEYFLDSWNPTFREDALFESSTMVSAVTALDKQILRLAPVLNSANVPSVVTTTSSSMSAPIDTMIKASGSRLYVFAAISRGGTATGTFSIAGLTGGATAAVVDENRTIPVSGGQFTDMFAANAVHIYQIDLSSVTCP